MTISGLLWEAYKDMLEAQHLLEKPKELTADIMKQVRICHDRAGCKLLEIESRLRGNVPPKRGDAP